MVTKRDLFSAEFLLDSDTNRLVEANAARDSARNTLMDVLGIPIGSQVTLLDRELEIDPLTPKVDRWIDTAVERRPEVLEVQELLAKNDLDIRVSKNGVFPQLDLVGAYGKSQEASALSRALDLPGEAWTAGLAFSIPIGNVAARSQLAQANVRQRRLEHELTQRKRQVEIEVRNAAIKLSRTTKSVSVLKNAIAHVHEKLEVAQGQFSLGLATNLDITDAQEDLLDTQTDLLTALADYHVGLAELEASVAGPL
jgi:outer membrane protein